LQVTLEQVQQHFGGLTKFARALGVTHQAVSAWGDTIPELRAYQIVVLSEGRFSFEDLPVRSKNVA
jgi:hypothetical protein